MYLQGRELLNRTGRHTLCRIAIKRLLLSEFKVRDASIIVPFSILTRLRPPQPAWSTSTRYIILNAPLSAVPGLCDSIGMEKGMAFVRLAGRLKDAITVSQPPTHDAADAPEHLPDGIRTISGGGGGGGGERIFSLQGKGSLYGSLDGGGTQRKKPQSSHL
ncbi:hypothetical protein B0H16DRAFT_1459276 [Mycena metata]|uniref:Uncharacterized protein n=1 Tax=Mycena metata TaxID=1033252 RepID=A0AAD7IZP6_9AGAR|nr:hypothetical protein B0H16DRAFT_1459276 [Mycena metata]